MNRFSTHSMCAMRRSHFQSRPPKEKLVAQLTNLRAHIYFPPEQIYVSQAEGIFFGIRVSARGQLIKRAEYQPSASVTTEEWQQRLSLAQRVVTELQKFN